MGLVMFIGATGTLAIKIMQFVLVYEMKTLSNKSNATLAELKLEMNEIVE